MKLTLLAISLLNLEQGCRILLQVGCGRETLRNVPAEYGLEFVVEF